MNSSVRLVVRALYRYPVKSCGAEPVDALEFAQDGLVRGDREWIVVDEQANPVWLGSHPRLLRQPKEGWAGLGWARLGYVVHSLAVGCLPWRLFQLERQAERTGRAEHPTQRARP